MKGVRPLMTENEDPPFKGQDEYNGKDWCGICKQVYTIDPSKSRKNFLETGWGGCPNKACHPPMDKLNLFELQWSSPPITPEEEALRSAEERWGYAKCFCEICQMWYGPGMCRRSGEDANGECPDWWALHRKGTKNTNSEMNKILNDEILKLLIAGTSVSEIMFKLNVNEQRVYRVKKRNGIGKIPYTNENKLNRDMKIKEGLDSGMSVKEIVKALNVSMSCVYSVKKNGVGGLKKEE
jgi:Mor family transcriptional regulator